MPVTILYAHTDTAPRSPAPSGTTAGGTLSARREECSCYLLLSRFSSTQGTYSSNNAPVAPDGNVNVRCPDAYANAVLSGWRTDATALANLEELQGGQCDEIT